MQRKGTPNSGSILSPFRTNLLLIFAFVEGAQIVLSFFLSISFSIYLSLLLHTYIYYITFFFLFILIFTQLSYCARCSFLPFSYSLYLHSFCLSIYISFLKVGHSLPLFIYFRLFNTADNKQVNKQMFNKILPMTRVELRTSGLESNRSTNWATTTSPQYMFLWNSSLCIFFGPLSLSLSPSLSLDVPLWNLHFFELKRG